MKMIASWLLFAFLLHCSSSQNVYISPTVNSTFVADNNNEFQVTCTVPEGTSVVHWYKDGNIINGNNRITNLTTGRVSRLTVRDIRLSDAGYYQCEVNNIQRSSISGYINVINIDITAPSPQQLIYQSNGTIECSSANDTTTFWHTVNPDSTIMSNATYSIGKRGLNITNVQLYHQQQYKCEHLLVTNHLTRSVIIDIEVLVPSTIMSAPKNTSVLKGQTFSISFDYLAIPPPNFTWYINDILYHKVNSTSEARNNHNMTFTNANKEGWYRCVVQNDLNTTEYTVFVDILIPPQIIAVDTQVAAVGTAVTLSCTSNGDSPINFRWRHSGNTLTNGGRISGAKTNTLTITGLTEADNGTYTCIATNAHGRDTASGSVTIIGLPKRASNVNINGITPTSAVVTWNIATNTLNHPVDHVFVNYHIMGSRDVTSVRVQSNTSQLMVEHLIPHTNYVVNIIPNNLAGNSTSTLDHHFKTKVGAPQIATVNTTSNRYNSIQLTVALLYTGGRMVTEFLIRYRIPDTKGWKSLSVTTNYTSINTPWSYILSDLQYHQRGYEVEVTAINSVGHSKTVVSLLTELSTVLPGKPSIMRIPSSTTQNSTTFICCVSDIGEPPLHKLQLFMKSPGQRVYNVTVPPSYSAGANVSIMADYLSSDTEYVFTCYASSVVGDGEHSDPITVRTDKASSSTTADDSTGGKETKIGISIGVACGVSIIVLLLIAILILYTCFVKKSNQNKYFVKSPPLAEENVLKISPGVMRRQFNFEQVGGGTPITRHQVSDTVNPKPEGLPNIRFSNSMNSHQEGLPSMRYSNTVTSNQGGLSSLQFSSQQSPISNGNYVPLSQQASNCFSSSCTRQLSNPTSNLNLQAGCSGSSATYPLSTDRITAHYHISGSITSSSLYDDEDSKLSYPPSTFATVV